MVAKWRSVRISAFIVLCLLPLAGCDRQGSEIADQFRERFLVTEPPSQPQTLSELMRTLAPAAEAPSAEATAAEATAASQAASQTGGGDQEPAPQGASPPAVADPLEPADPLQPAGTLQDVWVVGRIFAGDFDPWEQGRASFLISELPEEGHGEGHDADNCPFCKRKAAQAPKAMVRFADEKGQTVGIDARELFGLKTGDVVAVRGSAKVGELNTLMIDAAAIHRKR
jgi:hypothetical protein